MPTASRTFILAAFAALLPAIGLPGSAAAQPTWKQAGTTNTGNPVFIDARSVKRDSAGIIKATIRVRFTEPVKTPKGDWTSSRTYGLFDCRTNKVAATETIYYTDEAKGRIAERKVIKIPGYGVVFPNTASEIALKYVCANPPSR